MQAGRPVNGHSFHRGPWLLLGWFYSMQNADRLVGTRLLRNNKICEILKCCKTVERGRMKMAGK